MVEPQRQLLSGLLDAPLPASIYLSDFNSPEYVSALLDNVLENHLQSLPSSQKTRVVSLSPQTAPTISLMAARVFRQLGTEKAYDGRLDAARFVARLGPLVQQGAPLILRINQSERIVDSWPAEFLEILLRLDELVRLRLPHRVHTNADVEVFLSVAARDDSAYCSYQAYHFLISRRSLVGPRY